MTSLTVLGGSAASVGTGQGCSGYLVASGKTSLVLDLGPGTLLELRKHADFRQLDGIVLSHLHDDHMLDLIALRFSLAYNPVKPLRRTPLWLPPGGIEFFDRLAGVFSADEDPDNFFRGVFDIVEYDPDGHVQIGDLTLSFAPTVHFIRCWAIRAHPADDSGDLLYTADTGPAADLAGFATGAHIVLAEATTPEDQRGDTPHATRGHLSASEAANLAQDASAAILVLTHMFEEDVPLAMATVAHDIFSGEVVLAQPGVRVTWP
ncbi:MAG: MBL fold metallo-hydrolase [Chloroflexia bacterium]|jgi:ribonuclease BN (tRNA processing enzyme)|nr:MBL fold metallo-hydrolase [Chloroflexia bacterium]